PAVPLGIFFGRLANFVNGELWGKPWISATGEAGRWAMIFPHDPLQLPRHPSQLYEACLEGLVFAALLYVVARSHPPRWRVSGAFLLGYGVLRWVGEIFRESDTYAYLHTDVLSSGQLLSLPLMVVGAAMLYASTRRA
ncbi:MAG: prolipoprotein diacylglyceryl transferase, partial [Alphaproteobacteria bacterium]